MTAQIIRPQSWRQAIEDDRERRAIASREFTARQREQAAKEKLAELCLAAVVMVGSIAWFLTAIGWL